MTDNFIHSLGNIYRLAPGRTRSISAENPTGAKGEGGRAVPEKGSAAEKLGKGWKARPCITLKAGEETLLADIKGSGVIQHMWFTVSEKAYRSCILKIYWENQDKPSVQVPMGDFFANGHGIRCSINSMPINVNSHGGFNSYWPMPYKKGCRIAVENRFTSDIDSFFYQITYNEREVNEEILYFHSQWRRETTDRKNPDFTILPEFRGKGQYVGTYLAWKQHSNGWWGEGELKFFIDGDREYPTICGTGTEDYVGGAWCFSTGPYSAPFLGYPLHDTSREVHRHGLYRWHILDPIRFDSDLRVTVQALGWYEDIMKFQPLEDDIAATSYWYADRPYTELEEIPGLEDLLPR
ncbi:MAG: DUF2961 domain-containing protein [Spirochaetales bacterium]|nr:DUF2961 domain-containing protein [Spirochaetales bacterium]